MAEAWLPLACVPKEIMHWRNYFFLARDTTCGIMAWANAKGYFGSLLTAGVGYRALRAKNNAPFRGARH